MCCFLSAFLPIPINYWAELFVRSDQSRSMQQAISLVRSIERSLVPMMASQVHPPKKKMRWAIVALRCRQAVSCQFAFGREQNATMRSSLSLYLPYIYAIDVYLRSFVLRSPSNSEAIWGNLLGLCPWPLLPSGGMGRHVRPFFVWGHRAQVCRF